MQENILGPKKSKRVRKEIKDGIRRIKCSERE
jgi:hypothetical protein